ncbi:MAG: flagellar outer dynein arm light chain 2 [Monoraphidium minutum]|nr:MAG: flagellar outer dynein arm light chain 2 [Monoraphidium minutum]
MAATLVDDPAYGGPLKDMIVYENTYITDPTGYGPRAQFRLGEVQSILRAVLRERMDKQQYDPVKAAHISKHIAEDLREKVKALGCERHKLVIQVTLGQKAGQATRIASRCLWNAGTDGFASEFYENESMYCVCQVFAVYFE